MTLLILAEHNGIRLSAATLNTAGAAQKLGGEVHMLVTGHNISAVAQDAAKIANIAKILVADAPHYAHPLAENIAALAANIGKNYSHILAPASSYGKDIAPRLAALLDAPQVSDVTQVISADTFKHPVYAGNALETVQCEGPIIVLTIRQTAFDKINTDGNAVIEATAPVAESGLSSFVDLQETKLERPELTSARIVVSGGRGLGSAENFKILEKLADKLGAALGASRAAVDAGYVPNDYQVGQTGKVVAPALYIAVGISGAIQHLAGMKDSKVIVAINRDENAPIFEIANYGLVGDLFTILPELEKAL